MQVKWLRRALENLNTEAGYIARDSPESASRIVTAIISDVEHLAEYPAMGRAGRVPGTRELIVAGMPYIIPDRVRDKAVEILRVFHASRGWPGGS